MILKWMICMKKESCFTPKSYIIFHHVYRDCLISEAPAVLLNWLSRSNERGSLFSLPVRHASCFLEVRTDLEAIALRKFAADVIYSGNFQRRMCFCWFKLQNSLRLPLFCGLVNSKWLRFAHRCLYYNFTGRLIFWLGLMMSDDVHS